MVIVIITCKPATIGDPDPMLERKKTSSLLPAKAKHSYRYYGCSNHDHHRSR